MGIPVPPPLIIEPVPAGDDCLIGWGPGKPFGDGPTPESIVINFSGLTILFRTPEQNAFINSHHILPQVNFVPCQFLILNIDWLIEVRWLVNSSRCQIIADPFDFQAIVFFSATFDIAATEFFNQEEFNNINGSGFVKIPEVI